MGNKQYAAQQLAERFVDQREIQNVMGKVHVYHHDLQGR